MAIGKARKAKSRKRTAPKNSRRSGAASWAKLSDEELLDLRMCDLGLKLRGTVLEKRIRRVEGELERRSLRFRPHFWLSSEWFTPDGVPGVGLPFYLAHPRLMELEERQMFEVEGGTNEECMRLLRHEVGHAITNAYRLHRQREWRHVFGKASQPYTDYYRPKPYSRRYVLHLDYWYAQSHPTEDFAETFAVWLTPGLRWRERYAGWPALKKLEYVNSLMREIARRKPLVTSNEQVYPLSEIRIRLRRHYRQKRARYGLEYPDFYDRDLRRLFADASERRGGEPAAQFLNRIRPDLRRQVAHWTGEYQYTIDQVLKEMISRCRQLRLRQNSSPKQSQLDATIMLTVQTMNFLHGGHHRMMR